jgi:hypothetical protein
LERDCAEKIGVIEPSLQNGWFRIMQMTHEFREPEQARAAALHTKARQRDTVRSELMPEYARLDQRDDLVAEARWIKILDDIDQCTLGAPGIKIIDEMANADHKWPPRQQQVELARIWP